MRVAGLSRPDGKAAEDDETGDDWYNLYNRTLYFFVQREIEDEFVTPPGCKELRVEAVAGDYFTGESWLLAKSEGQIGNHTRWGTGIYFLGHFVWPRLRVFHESWFVPGRQTVRISAFGGFGSVTYWVNGTSG